MPTIVLDATNSSQVSSAKVLEAQLGDSRMLIFTGIAIPEWDSQSNLDRATVIVKFGRTAAVISNFTACLGLASIGNSDSDFTFATDDVSIDTDEQGQIQLTTNIAVQGEPSVLHRFSYQANVITNTSLISGTIRWSRETATLLRTSQLFNVDANIITPPPSPGMFGGTQTLAEGHENVAPVLNGDLWSVTYSISNPPLGQQLYITPHALAFTYGPGDLRFRQTSGPSPCVLTPQSPAQTNIDFEMVFEAIR